MYPGEVQREKEISQNEILGGGSRLESLRAYCVPPTFPICPVTLCESDCTVPILQMKGFPDSSVGKESASSAGDLGVIPGLGRSPGEGIGWLPTPVFLDFSGSSSGKECVCNAGNLGLTLGLGRSLEESMATHSSILAWRILMDREAWWAPVHGVPKSRTWLSDKEQHASCRWGSWGSEQLKKNLFIGRRTRFWCFVLFFATLNGL